MAKKVEKTSCEKASTTKKVSKKTKSEDKSKKELVWQGIGTGALRIQNRQKKENRINEFVKEIISKFPPGA